MCSAHVAKSSMHNRVRVPVLIAPQSVAAHSQQIAPSCVLFPTWQTQVGDWQHLSQTFGSHTPQQLQHTAGIFSMAQILTCCTSLLAGQCSDGHDARVARCTAAAAPVPLKLLMLIHVLTLPMPPIADRWTQQR